MTLTEPLSFGQNQLQRLQSPAKHLHESEGPFNVYKIMILVVRAFSNDQSSIGMAPNPSRSGSPGSPPPHLEMKQVESRNEMKQNAITRMRGCSKELMQEKQRRSTWGRAKTAILNISKNEEKL